MSEQIKNLNRRVSNLERAIHRLESICSPRKQNQAGISPQAASGQEGSSAPGEIPSILPTPAHTNNPQKSGDKPSPRRKFRTRVWRQIKRMFLKRDRLERVGILFGIIYAVTTLLQWRDLRHNFEVEQRAWLKVTFGWPIKPTSIVLAHIENVGKSPAFDTMSEFVFTVLDKNTPPPFHFIGAHTFTIVPSVFFPGQPMTVQSVCLEINGLCRTLSKSPLSNG